MFISNVFFNLSILGKIYIYIYNEVINKLYIISKCNEDLQDDV